MSSRAAVIERARADLDAGRPWKARDRLVAAQKHDPWNQDVLDLLGEVYYAMGDHPSAARYWLLTDREGPEVRAVTAAFEERWGHNLGERLKMIPVRDPIADYPPQVAARLEALAAEAERAGITWPRERRDNSDAEDESRLWDWLIVPLIVILGPGLWLLGLALAVYLVISTVS